MNNLSVFSDLVKPQPKAEFTGYSFEGIPDLYADNYGNFWYKGERIDKQYRERQTFIYINGKRYGIATLRTLARKTFVDFMPF